MFTSKKRYRHYDLDFFDSGQPDEPGRPLVKFKLLTRRLKTRPLWWAITLFILIAIIYWYLRSFFL